MREEVKKKILEYVQRKSSSNLALFIDGPWGTGKTHLIHELVNSFTANDPTVVYVSLFGVTSIDQLRLEVSVVTLQKKVARKTPAKWKQWMHDMYFRMTKRQPRNRNNSARSFVKKIANDLEVLGGNYRAVSKALSFLLTQTKFTDLVVILDDIERSKIDGSELLGMVAFWIEECNHRVIMIGNLTKTEAHFQKQFENHYSKIVGERLLFIGNSIEVLSERLEVIRESQSDEVRRCIDTILQEMKIAASYDVRSVIHIFNRTYDLVKEILEYCNQNAIEISQAVLDIAIRTIVSTSLAYRMKELCDNDIDEYDMVDDMAVGAHVRQPDREGPKPMTVVLTRHGIRASEVPITGETLLQIVSTGNVPISKVVKELLARQETSADSQHDWLSLWHMHEIRDDAELNNIYEQVKSSWEKRVYTEAHEIMHVFCVLVRVLRIRKAEHEVEMLIKDLERYLATQIIHNEGTGFRIDGRSAYGYGYALPAGDAARDEAESAINQALLRNLVANGQNVAKTWPRIVAEDPKYALELIEIKSGVAVDEVIYSFDAVLDAPQLVRVLVDERSKESFALLSRFLARYERTTTNYEVLKQANGLLARMIDESDRIIVESENESKSLRATRAREIKKQLVEAQSKVEGWLGVLMKSLENQIRHLFSLPDQDSSRMGE